MTISTEPARRVVVWQHSLFKTLWKLALAKYRTKKAFSFWHNPWKQGFLVGPPSELAAKYSTLMMFKMDAALSSLSVLWLLCNSSHSSPVNGTSLK